MIILIDLTVAGIDTGSFDLYSNADGYTTPFAQNITRQQLLDGYQATVDNSTTDIKLRSLNEICPGDTILPVDTTTSTTSTTSSTSTSTTTSTTTAALCTIGQLALGGVIAYILQQGDPGYVEGVCKGLVATVSDISTGVAWGCRGTAILGARGTAIGTGMANTMSIDEDCQDAPIAAKLCFDLNQGGYSDWFLPSKDELNALYINRVAIGGFANEYYWSSTEVNAFTAYMQTFDSGALTGADKNLIRRVRAIRTF